MDPGSVHDMRAFRKMLIHHEPEEFFGRRQYLLADSAYELTEKCVTPYKRPALGSLTPNQKGFNKQLSGLRIKVEHTIGTLKARFASLRCLPHWNITSKEEFNWCLAWVGACIVLHNMYLKHDDWGIPVDEYEFILAEIAAENAEDN